MAGMNGLEDFIDLLGRKPARTIVAAYCAATIVAYLDYATGPDLTFSLLYLLPIAICACASRPAWTYILCGLCTAYWRWSTGLFGDWPDVPALSNEAWKFGSQLATYCIFGFLAERQLDLVRKLRSNVRELESSNEDKSLLLRELRHRVKNSFSLVVNLIELEGPANGRGGDKKSLVGRVISLAALYDLLAASDEATAAVPLSGYIRAIAKGLEESYASVSRGIRIETELAELAAAPKQASSIGMIVNELVTDSLKYAFPDGRGGTVALRLSARDGETELEVRDDGIGMPGNLDPHAGLGFGLRLVDMLARDLGGSFRIEVSAGTRFLVRFPLGG